jgi:1-phosphofructokinase
VLGYSPQALETAVAQGDPEPVVTAARQLVDRGVGAVLATLGAAGAVLVDETGSWMATPPPIIARSTVGAGDSSLAGYLRADVGGAVPPSRLQMAVAYGSAAAALPGSALPAPAQVDLDAVRVTPIAPNAPITNTKVSP